MRPDIRHVECKKILTRTGGFLYSFTHTLNPYAGCAFGANGCGVYCYVAESPIGRHAHAPWGLWVDAKTNAASKLKAELSRKMDCRRLRIFMGSSTDPYQPAECQLKITRAVLTVLRSFEVGLLVIQTRSPLVERDYDLLAEMPFAWLSMTVETDDDKIRRALTPTCPSIDRRVLAMVNARRFGIKVQAAVSPVLPHDPLTFANLLARSADRVVVDTFVSGDGAKGRRTSRRPLPAQYRQMKWSDWRDETTARTLYQTLRGRLGENRVAWSCDGFNDL